MAPSRRRLDFRSLFEHAIEGMYRTSPDGRYLAANAALARIYGYDAPGDLIRGLTDIATGLYHDPQDRERFKRALAEGDGIIHNFESQVCRKDGALIWISENARAVVGEDGNLECYEGTVQDITERKQAEERQRLAGAVFDSVDDSIVVLDLDLNILMVNPAFERATGWAAADVLGRPSELIASELHGDDEVAAIFSQVRTGEPWHGEVWARRQGGETFPVLASLTGVAGEGGRIDRLVMICRDISGRKRDEQRIRFHATHDALTRLLNRFAIMEGLNEAIERAANGDGTVMVLFLDINRFKDVNDSFGHAAGDALLRQSARRLASCARPADLVGRIGGDEFVIVLNGATNRGDALAVLESVRAAFADPFFVAGREVYVSTTAGISVFPDDGDTAESLLTSADTAMFSAKATGRPFRFFDQEMSRQAIERVNLEKDLRLALERGEFRLVYQPKVSAVSRRVVGAEALIRWSHPVRGEVSPAFFVPVAERAGLIGPIGDWTIAQTCRQIRDWMDAGHAPPAISINLSPAQFQDNRLIDKVRASLHSARLSPHAIELEITETMVATEVDHAINILTELGRMGVVTSIDDFGTGYSSLSYLKLFPVQNLKIDRAFVRELPGNSMDGAIVSSVMALASNMGFGVIAEGVETESQAAFLLGRGCTIMQGFLFSTPVEADDFVAML